MEKKKRMFSWMSPKLEVRETKKYGKGVFAKKEIKKDEVVIVMGGYILDINDENELVGFLSDKPIEISEHFSFGPLKKEDIDLMPQHYVNSSCNPNIGFNGQIFMVAIKNIKIGEEITYDYAMVMHPNKKSNSYFKIKCLCGYKKCRKYITEDDWKIPELQKKYDGYFQFFLQKKINKLKIKN